MPSQHAVSANSCLPHTGNCARLCIVKTTGHSTCITNFTDSYGSHDAFVVGAGIAADSRHKKMTTLHKHIALAR